MTILYGFKLDPQGRVIHRLFDQERMPPDWYTAPDKIPGNQPIATPKAEPRPKLKLKGKK